MPLGLRRGSETRGAVPEVAQISVDRAFVEFQSSYWLGHARPRLVPEGMPREQSLQPKLIPKTSSLLHQGRPWRMGDC